MQTPKRGIIVKQIIGYLRVSTREQGHKRNGLEAQRETIERFAQAEGIMIVEWHEEYESGKGFLNAFDKRPELAKALDHAKRLKCSVVVSKLDRLSRDVAFFNPFIHSAFNEFKVVLYSLKNFNPVI